MNELDQSTRKSRILFILATLFTFSFITILQFTPTPWFFLALIAMHVGIALFIISKRSFKKAGFKVSQFYKTQYLLLLPYILVMIYTFAARAGIVPLFADEKTILVLCYSLFCAFITVWNYLRMKRSLDQQTIENRMAPSVVAD